MSAQKMTTKSAVAALALSLGVGVLLGTLRPARAMNHGEGELTENRYALACKCATSMQGESSSKWLVLPDSDLQKHFSFTFGYVKSTHIDGEKDALCSNVAKSGSIKAARTNALALFTYLSNAKNGHLDDIRQVGYGSQKFDYACVGEVADVKKVSKSYKDEPPTEIMKSAPGVHSTTHSGGVGITVHN